MKTLMLICITLIGQSAWAHGDIEKIDCSDEKKAITLMGLETKTKGTMSFTLTQKNKTLLKNVQSKIDLEDVVKNKKVYEQIKFKFPKKGMGHLSVLEDYSKEVRDGTGKLAVNGVKTDELKCKVTY